MRLTRRGRLTVTLSVTTLLVVATSYVVTRSSVAPALGLPTHPPCTVTADGQAHEWSRAQAMTATTVAGVGLRLAADTDAVATALARGLAADRDGAITAAAADRLYRELPDAARPPAATVALARALLGYDGGALTCTLPTLRLGGGPPRQDPGPLGLTDRADTVRLAMRAVFGKQILGGFEPRGVRSGHVEGSAHYEGRAIDVFFRPVTDAGQRRGWAQALWAVAHADRLDVATVIFDREVWSATRSVQGWRTYEHPDGPTGNPILLHEDHVHVDVDEGG